MPANRLGKLRSRRRHPVVTKRQPQPQQKMFDFMSGDGTFKKPGVDLLEDPQQRPVSVN